MHHFCMQDEDYEQRIFSEFKNATLVHSVETEHGTLRVYDLKKIPFRCLFLDSQFSSCINLKTGKAGLGYLRTMQKKLDSFAFAPNVLVLGHGGGSLAKSALEFGCTVTSVDIIPELFSLSMDHFLVPSSPHFTPVVRDAFDFIQTTNMKFDIIFVDVFVNAEDVPPRFKTKRWFSLLKRRLTPGGIICMNYIGHDNKAHDFMKLQGACLEYFPDANFDFLEGPGHLHQNIIITLKNRARAKS